MAHFAKVEDGIVTQVIVAEQDFVDTQPGTWIQTSYNTRGGVHYEPNSDTPSANQTRALRGNYAGLGYTYDATNDVFYGPAPFPSWTLNTTTWTWQAPVAMPDNNPNNRYAWNEDTQSWDLVEVLTS
jgi:hypothetical protein